MHNTKNHKKIALVLSSGGARGIAHIGVIRELEARDYEITSISGTSIGAVIGGFYAAGKLDEYEAWVSGLGLYNVFNLMDFSFSAKGFIKGQRVFKKLSEWMDGVTFEDLRIPFSCVATDLKNRKEVVLDTGDVLAAIRASVAIPGYFEPSVTDDDTYLYDGGIVNPLPINRVQRNGAELVFAVDLNAYQPLFDPKKYWQESKPEESLILKRVSEVWQTAVQKVEVLQRLNTNEKQSEQKGPHNKEKHLSHIGALLEMFEMMQENITAQTIREQRPDVLIEIPGNLCNTFEFHRGKELIEFGRIQTQKVLDKYQSF